MARIDVPHRQAATVAIFGPSPLLTVTIEVSGAGDEIHVHAGGQGVWLSRMAAELGAHPILCGFLGGETGEVLRPRLECLSGERRLVHTSGPSGAYVMDRRSGRRVLVSAAWAPAPTRHELDDLFSITCAAALESRVLAICNPMPGPALPLDIYANLVSDVRANGTPVLVDLSSPRLDHALDGQPDLVKLNDWELAEFVSGPVNSPAELRAAVDALRDRGAGTVVVTRGGDSALAFRDGEALELVPPRFEHGSREGCGDSMMGALAAAWATGLDWRQGLVLGMAAGAANFLRHGLGTGDQPVVEELLGQIQVRGLPSRWGVTPRDMADAPVRR